MDAHRIKLVYEPRSSVAVLLELEVPLAISHRQASIESVGRSKTRGSNRQSQPHTPAEHFYKRNSMPVGQGFQGSGRHLRRAQVAD